MQTKKQTHKEIMLNQVVGIILGWLIVFLLFPFFDFLPQVIVATISSVLFFMSSYTRGYIIRRGFNKQEQAYLLGEDFKDVIVELPDITKVEVVDSERHTFNKGSKIRISVQDNGETLKCFID